MTTLQNRQLSSQAFRGAMGTQRFHSPPRPHGQEVIGPAFELRSVCLQRPDCLTFSRRKVRNLPGASGNYRRFQAGSWKIIQFTAPLGPSRPPAPCLLGCRGLTNAKLRGLQAATFTFALE